LPLLRKSEDGVENDDRNDGETQRRKSGGKRQRRGDPEEEREWMRQLARQLPGPAAAATFRELVGAVRD
jgi:hypothetical protein